MPTQSTAVLTAALLAVTPCLPAKPTPPAAQPVRVVIQRMQGYGGYEAFAQAAAHKLEQVINSDAFRVAVTSTSYTYREVLKKKPKLTSDQILAAIVGAHEMVGPGGQDGVIDLRLRTINDVDDGKDWPGWQKDCTPGSSVGTIGVDGSGDGITATCPQWLAKYAAEKDTASLAAHFMHEYTHVLGFRHAYFVILSGKSVPYQLQQIVYDLAKPKQAH